MESAPVERRGALAEKYLALLEITEAIVARQDFPELCKSLSEGLREVADADNIALILYDPGSRRAIVNALVVSDPGVAPVKELPVEETVLDEVIRTGRSVVIPDLEQETRWERSLAPLKASGLRSTAAIQLRSARRFLGVLGFGSFRKDAYPAEDLAFLDLVGKQVALAVENVLSFQELHALKKRLADRAEYLEEEIRTELDFGDIIGESVALQQVLEQIRTVAPTDSAVLILGETGTGKELVARAIHSLSGRKSRAFVKMNCAAIPTGLLESDLFGHEKGAFTGALAQKPGRFELAHEGTMFLDEVGDISLELQPKLLRVLQEHEFERLGGTKTIRVDARLVAATNRDLDQMVQDKEFRSDLFYRLNVFPIRVPPLRERPEDIPLLIRHFLRKAARRLRKDIREVPEKVLEALSAYPWPGNIRELENFIERAAILTQGSQLEVPLSELKSARSAPFNSLEAAERDTVIQALRESKWVIGGPSGAAARLGLKRTTLQSKMRRLGIRPE